MKTKESKMGSELGIEEVKRRVASHWSRVSHIIPFVPNQFEGGETWEVLGDYLFHLASELSKAAQAIAGYAELCKNKAKETEVSQ